MNAQTVGVLLATLGFWIAYCGVYGIPVWDTLVAIIRKPGQAQKVIADAKTKATASLLAMPSTSTGIEPEGAGIRTGVFGTAKISRGFALHKAQGSTSPGIDFIMPKGTPLPAIFSGVVTNTANRNALAGNVTSVRRPNGDVYEYLHVSGFKVLNGTEVKAGQFIALSGGRPGDQGAGNSTGEHVHLQYFKNGILVDPMLGAGI